MKGKLQLFPGRGQYWSITNGTKRYLHAEVMFINTYYGNLSPR